MRSNILILKFPYSSTFGGGEKHTLTLVDNLPHNFVLLSTCSVLLPEFKRRNLPHKKIWAGTEPVTPMALILFIFTWPFIWLNIAHNIWRLQHRYSLTHVYCLSLTEKVLITPLAYWLGLKIIWVEHLQIENWLLKSFLKFIYVLNSRWANVITVAQAVAQQLAQLGVAQKNIQVIYNSINIDTFSAQATPINNPFKILFVGRLESEKGVPDLLEAVSSLNFSYHLTIVGDGSQAAYLEAYAAKLNIAEHITMAGFQTNIAKWLHQHHALVLPAIRRETFGIVLAEAIATLTPVIATRVGGMPEVVGDNGWIVPPHQPDAITEALQKIQSNYNTAIKRTTAGRQRLLELFHQDAMLSAYDTAFQQ